MDTVGVGSLRSPFKPLEFYIFQGFFSKFNWKRGADWVPHELSPNYGDPRCQRLAALAVQTDTMLVLFFLNFITSKSQIELERRNYFPPASIKMIDTPHAGQRERSERFKLTRLTRVKNRVPRLSSLQL